MAKFFKITKDVKPSEICDLVPGTIVQSEGEEIKLVWVGGKITAGLLHYDLKGYDRNKKEVTINFIYKLCRV